MLVALSEEAGAAAGSTAAAPSYRLLFLGLAIIAVAKLVILVANGPSLLPDSDVYIVYADAILDHARGFAPVEWGAEAVPIFIFRPAGYPLVLAGAKLISPASYAVVVVIVQGVVNCIAIGLMFVVATRLLRSSRAALLAVLLYAASSSALWDNAILSDSLYASLWNIVVFALLGHLLGCWRLSLGQTLGLGILWGFSLWLRDVGIYFTLLPVLLFLLIAVRERDRRLAAFARPFLFLAVVTGMAGSAVLLNYHRTGEPFFSITGLGNWLRPVFDMAQDGYAQPFADDELVSSTVHETMTDYTFASQLAFLDELNKRCRCTPTQMQSLVFAEYLSAVEHHPVAYARVVARNFNYFALGELVADPVATIDQFFELGTSKPEWRIPGLSLRNLAALRRHFSLTMLLLMLLSAVAEIVSAIVFTAYLFGTPYFLVRAIHRQQALTGEWVAVAFLWFSFVGVSLAFALVHYEARHALPLFPAAAIGIVYVALRAPENWLPGAATRATEYR
jgi:hypothetical protein